MRFPANRCGADSPHFLAGRSPERRLEIFFAPLRPLGKIRFPAAVAGGNRRKRSSFLSHQLGGLTARLHGKSETASKVEVQDAISEVDA
ncbi:hypothetical protein [Brevibacillus sp. 179-C 1.1 NHS]|uniref:hypothetical protein n=1 Tax=Brevibacillus sp. 179-C 1.1 NHS TaxID=3235177 RepID=UPI0039A166D8